MDKVNEINKEARVSDLLMGQKIGTLKILRVAS